MCFNSDFFQSEKWENQRKNEKVEFFFSFHRISAVLTFHFINLYPLLGITAIFEFRRERERERELSEHWKSLLCLFAIFILIFSFLSSFFFSLSLPPSLYFSPSSSQSSLGNLILSNISSFHSLSSLPLFATYFPLTPSFMFRKETHRERENLLSLSGLSLSWIKCYPFTFDLFASCHVGERGRNFSLSCRFSSHS